MKNFLKKTLPLFLLKQVQRLPEPSTEWKDAKLWANRGSAKLMEALGSFYLLMMLKVLWEIHTNPVVAAHQKNIPMRFHIFFWGFGILCVLATNFCARTVYRARRYMKEQGRGDELEMPDWF